MAPQDLEKNQQTTNIADIYIADIADVANIGSVQSTFHDPSKNILACMVHPSASRIPPQPFWDASISVTTPGRGSPKIAGNRPRPACQETSGRHRARCAAQHGRARVCSTKARGGPESAAGYRGKLREGSKHSSG